MLIRNKNNFRILKRHMRIFRQSILKAHVKFQTDRLKTVEGDARIRCLLHIHFCGIRALYILSKNAKKYRILFLLF